MACSNPTNSLALPYLCRTPQRDASTPPAVHEVPAEQLHSFCALSVLNVQLRGQRVVLKSPRATRLSVSWTRRPMACPCPATPCPLQRRQLPLPCDTPSPLPGVSAPGHLRLLRTLSLGHRRPSVDGYAAASRQAAVATPRGYSAYRYSEALVSPRAVVTPRISNNSGGQQSSFSSHPNPPPQLPPELQLHVLSFLPPNDLALSGRAACREAWVSFDQPEHRAARLSQPLPTHAVQPFLEYGSVYGMRLLPFRRKLQLLSTAAASGCEANLEVAWGLLRLCVPPELLLPPPGAGDGAGAASILDRYGSVLPDPGVEAVRHGHVHLLRWLLQHRCPLQPSATLEAAAAHCDLAGMQAAWQLLQGNAGDGQRLELGPGVLAAAVGSATPKWQAKADWVLQQAQQRASPLLGVLAAVAAARTGDLSRLRWLLAHGCPMGSWEVLEAALQHADLCITRWLVEQAGCCRVPDQEDEEAWGYLTAAAAASPIDPVPKLQWLHHRGLASLLLHDAGGSAELLQSAAVAAAQAGQLQSLQWLHEVCRYRYRYGGAEQLLTGEVFRAAAGPGNIPTAAWLLRHGCPADPGAYKAAACRGDLAMLTWLAREARCHVHPGAAPAIILAWPQGPAWGTRRPSARPGPALDQMAAPGVGGGAGDLLRALCVLEEAADAADEAAAPGGGPIAKDSMSSSGSSSRCLDAAALRGDVELVRYLLQQQGKRAGAGGGGAGAAGSRGCPRRPPARTVRLAAEGGCVAVVELLAREVGFEEDVWGWGDSYDKAVRRGDRAMVECLRGLGI